MRENGGGGESRRSRPVRACRLGALSLRRGMLGSRREVTAPVADPWPSTGCRDTKMKTSWAQQQTGWRQSLGEESKADTMEERMLKLDLNS